MPRIGSTSAKSEKPKSKGVSLYSDVCKNCSGSEFDPYNQAICRQCSEKLCQVHYQVFEGFLRNQMQAGAKISHDSVKRTFCVTLGSKKFASQHLIDALKKCWEYRFENGIGCLKKEEMELKINC